MSGRNQHFIPQSLLRGFGVKRGKKTYVVAYTYDRGIFAPPTDGIGAEGNFYSELDVEDETETLDDKITAYEQRIPAVLEQLRQPSDEADPALAAELVTHLTVRNDHFRKATSAAGAGLVEGMGNIFNSEDTARQFMGVAGDEPSSLFASQLPELWGKLRPLAGLIGITNEEQFNVWAFQMVKTNFPSLHAEMVGTLNQTFSNILENVPEVAADAQRRSLEKSLTPEKRVDRLVEYRWQTLAPEDSVVLPDCVAVGVDTGNGLLPLMLADLDHTETIFMPIASDRLLVGSLTSDPELPPNINEVFAGCSWDFFVARDRTTELEGFRSSLRTTTDRFMTVTVTSAIDESLGKRNPR